MINQFELQKLIRVNSRILKDMNAVVNNTADESAKINVCDMLAWALNYISETENATIDEVIRTRCGYDLTETEVSV